MQTTFVAIGALRVNTVYAAFMVEFWLNYDQMSKTLAYQYSIILNAASFLSLQTSRGTDTYHPTHRR